MRRRYRRNLANRCDVTPSRARCLSSSRARVIVARRSNIFADCRRATSIVVRFAALLASARYRSRTPPSISAHHLFGRREPTDTDSPARAVFQANRIDPLLMLIGLEAERAKSLAIQRVSPEELLSATVAKICATDKSNQRFYADRTFGDLGQGCLPSLQSSALPAISLISRWPRTRQTSEIS